MTSNMPSRIGITFRTMLHSMEAASFFSMNVQIYKMGNNQSRCMLTDVSAW